jgi:hypothetical protein
MAKRFNEQIDYGNTPERMDPNLERKLGSPENIYANNPALKNGPADVERLVSGRFQEVANKLRQVTGIQDLSSKQVQGMVYQEMMGKLSNVMRIESAHTDELIELAIEASLEETEADRDWYQIEASLGMPNADNFRLEPEDDKEEEDDDEEKEDSFEIPSFDVEDLTDEEIFELEKHKRNIINAMIQGFAKKGHFLFQKPEVKAQLDAIDPSLYRDYLGIMAINDFMYFTMEQMIEMMSQTGQGVAGKVEMDDADEEEGGGEEEGEYQPDTKIIATGLIFPILCHELVKGFESAVGRHGQSQDPVMREKVKGQTDTLPNEPMQLRIGPPIVEKFRMALPDELFEEKNKGLSPFFRTLLYQIPAQEFLKLMGNAIDDKNPSNVAKATSKFKEIMKEAMTMKEEFESYKEDENINSDNDDDGFEDFLGSLNIILPPKD